MRFEEPDGQNRWDSPLIPIGYDDKQLPFDTIWEAIVLKKGPKPNHATVMKPAVGTNFLQELDKNTTMVVNEIVQYQNLGNPVGGEVLVRNVKGDGEQYRVIMPAHSVSIAQLQRMRRTYVSLNRMRNVESGRIVPLFVEYLNHAFEHES
ncbi:unnamed protein product [Ambrosiozyma monospora]|uniref:Unnamed protein product n=1 Tax=Ambrosiozyma monospora TaxID=43982 RepID=A0ACB5TX76_AMBMO|nr:unnamed protein product [Ambrosiozyma monospora]